MAPRFKIVTVSDSASMGLVQDTAGPAVSGLLASHGFEVISQLIIADGVESVAQTLADQCSDFDGIVVTVGGTGFGPRDLTPEGTLAVVERQAPGLAEALRNASPSGLGRLNRSIAGTIGQTLIVNLPGSVKGATECLEALVDVFGHIHDLLIGQKPH